MSSKIKIRPYSLGVQVKTDDPRERAIIQLTAVFTIQPILDSIYIQFTNSDISKEQLTESLENLESAIKETEIKSYGNNKY